MTLIYCCAALMMVASIRDAVLTRDAADLLLSVPDVNVNLTNSRSQTALHTALVKKNFTLAHQILNHSECDVNKRVQFLFI